MWHLPFNHNRTRVGGFEHLIYLVQKSFEAVNPIASEGAADVHLINQ
jgi:hypothetical protein